MVSQISNSYIVYCLGVCSLTYNTKAGGLFQRPSRTAIVPIPGSAHVRSVTEKYGGPVEEKILNSTRGGINFLIRKKITYFKIHRT